MNRLCDTKEIFAQLADTDGSNGVKTLIETHDAWVHNEAVLEQISVAMRAQLARAQRSDALTRRIERQRDALANLVVRRPRQALSAG
jgi:hypothetical protein